jgi:hypothetical protein
MQLCDDLTEQRAKTIAFWSTYSYAGTEADISRVYAFRELDPATATNEDVTRAYGGPGWAHVEPCAECGSEARRVRIGGVVLCESCIAHADALLTPPVATPGALPTSDKEAIQIKHPEPAKTGFFSRILGG